MGVGSCGSIYRDRIQSAKPHTQGCKPAVVIAVGSQSFDPFWCSFWTRAIWMHVNSVQKPLFGWCVWIKLLCCELNLACMKILPAAVLGSLFGFSWPVLSPFFFFSDADWTCWLPEWIWWNVSFPKARGQIRTAQLHGNERGKAWKASIKIFNSPVLFSTEYFVLRAALLD